MYVLRYVTSNAGRGAPSATVRPAPGEGGVVFVAVPGAAEGELEAPGGALVILADRAATLEITVHPRGPSGSVDAQFNLEMLAPGVERSAGSSVERAPWDEARPRTVLAGAFAPERDDVDAAARPVGVTFVAHVARRGDVVVTDGEWAAGPNQPAPIEGIEVRAVGGEVEVETQFLNARDGRWSPWLRPGSFAGTRGQARPLTGLRFRLSGRAADRFTLQGEALFLGSPVLAQSGPMIDLTSAGGADTLIGLRLTIKTASAPSNEVFGAEKPPRVRIFRAARP